MTPRAPVPAAVAVPYRRSRSDAADGDLEVYWVRRADSLAFLGGFWAFPGGRVEAGDRERRVPGADGERAAQIAAAARELAEETGVALEPEASRFVYGGRTVTPAWSPLRFDAAYFLVELPGDAHPDAARSGGELTAGEWVRPVDALAAWARGERLTSPVVLGALLALRDGRAGADARMPALLQEDARVWELAPGIGLAMLRSPTVPPAAHTNCYVVGAASLVVIDPGSPYPEEIAALDAALDGMRAEGRAVREVWLTHHHVDHVSGAAHLAARLGVPIAAHRQTAEALAGRVRVSRLVEDGDLAVLAAGAGRPERRLRALHTPGHAPGHLCWLEEGTRFLIAGDMVAGLGTILIDPPEGDMADYLRSLERLRALGARAILPAHGPALASPARVLDEYLRHRRWREEVVARALAARGEADAGELVAEVYGDVPPALHPLARRSLLAHLLKLVREGRARGVEGERFAWAADAPAGAPGPATPRGAA